jgi:bacteriorhodopsin
MNNIGPQPTSKFPVLTNNIGSQPPSNFPVHMNNIEPDSPIYCDEESVMGNNTIIRQATNTYFTDPNNKLNSDNPNLKALILALEQQGMINQSPKENVNVLESAHKVIERQRSKVQALHTPCLDYYCEQLCWLTQFAFTISSLVLLILYATHNHPAGFVNTFFVQSIAAVAYFVKASHAGEVVISGTHIPFVRYVDWITTTPLMLYELCHIAHAPVYAIVMIIGCDLMTLSLGITSAVIDQKKHLKVKYTLFLVAVGFYIMMVCTLIMDVSKPLHEGSSHHRLLAGSDDHGDDHGDDDGHDNAAVIKLFDDLEVLTIVSWSFYPFAVLLGRAHFGIITQSVEDGFICMLDIISKIGMEGIIIAYVVNHH